MQRPNHRYTIWYFVHFSRHRARKNLKGFPFRHFEFFTQYSYSSIPYLHYNRINSLKLIKKRKKKLGMPSTWYSKHHVKISWRNSKSWVLHERTTNASIARLAQPVKWIKKPVLFIFVYFGDWLKAPTCSMFLAKIGNAQRWAGTSALKPASFTQQERAKLDLS